MLAPSYRLRDEIAAARDFRVKAKAANTLRAYRSDWVQFEGWCDMIRAALAGGHPWLEGVTYERLWEEGHARLAAPEDSKDSRLP